MRSFLSLCGVAVLVGGLAAALALLFIPLRLVAVPGGVGYCGPGFSSDNALQVRVNPGIVNTGGGAGQQATAAQQRQLEQVCTSQANGRLIAATSIAAVALVLGVPLIAVGRRQDMISASSSGPSLSSSGTPGSTVWK
jgi:hypothetical protein